MIKEKEVWVKCGLRTDEHYESLGYNIPRRKNKQGKLTVPPNTRILVKTDHLPPTSTALVTKVCDFCGEQIPNLAYGNIIESRKTNNGKDYCKSCSSKKNNAIRLEKVEYEMTLEYYAIHNNKEYLLKEFSDKNKKKPNEIFKSSGMKLLWNCSTCKSEYPSPAARRTSGQNCPYCAGQKLKIGVNDLWSTHPEVAKLLKHPQRGYEITAGKHCEEVFVCNKCNYEETKKLANVVYGSFSCLCSDGISYPEKFMMSVLNQLGVKFKTQSRFSWAKGKRYDFYIPSIGILETHGLQHYEEGFKMGKSLKEQMKNDELKEQLAKSNGIKNYIVIDCRLSDLDFIKNNIIKSKLSTLFNLQNIEWLKCHEYACDSLVKATCDLWNKGMKNTLHISKVLNLGRNTIIKYLKQGSMLKICDYNPQENKGSLKDSRPIVQLSMNGDLIKEYESMGEASSAINIHKNGIWRCCKGYSKTAGNFKWMYKEDFYQYQKAN